MTSYVRSLEKVNVAAAAAAAVVAVDGQGKECGHGEEWAAPEAKGQGPVMAVTPSATTAKDDLALAVEMTPEAYSRALASFLHVNPHLTDDIFKARQLHEPLERHPIAPPPTEITTMQHVLQRLLFNDYVAQVHSACLGDSLGLVAPAHKASSMILLQKSQPSYPSPSIKMEKPADKAFPTLNGYCGRDLQDFAYQRYPYNAHTIPSPFQASSAFVTYEKMPYSHFTSIMDGKKYLLTVRTELPVNFLHADVFLQAKLFFMPSPLKHGDNLRVETGPLIILLLTWNECEKTRVADAVTEFPIPLYEIVRINSPWRVPTLTQIVDLITNVACAIDAISDGLYFVATLNSVYVTNPSALGTTTPLQFRFCPFACGLVQELPLSVNRDLLMRRSFCTLLLGIALWTSEPMRLDFHSLIPESYIAAPGLVAAFHELWDKCEPNLDARFLFGPDPGDDEPLAIDDSSEWWSTLDAGVNRLAELRRTLTSAIAESNPNFPGKSPLSFLLTLSRLNGKGWCEDDDDDDEEDDDDSFVATSSSLSSSSSTRVDEKKKKKSSENGTMKRGRHSPRTTVIVSNSPSIETFRALRSRGNPSDFRLHHLPALITGMACIHSRTVNRTAVDAYYKMLLDATENRYGEKSLSALLLSPVEFEQVISMSALCIGSIVPCQMTGLTDPSSVTKSSHWICRMFSLFVVLDELARAEDYGMLRRAQEVCLAAGLSSQLGDSLGPGSSSTSSVQQYHSSNQEQERLLSIMVLVPSVCVAIVASVQFSALQSRRIYNTNVVKMARLLFIWQQCCANEAAAAAMAASVKARSSSFSSSTTAKSDMEITSGGGGGGGGGGGSNCVRDKNSTDRTSASVGVRLPRFKVECLVSMMLVMSDAATWLPPNLLVDEEGHYRKRIIITNNQSNTPLLPTPTSSLDLPNDDQVMEKCVDMWLCTDDASFVDRVLPCWTMKTSHSTTALLVGRLEMATEDLIGRLRRCAKEEEVPLCDRASSVESTKLELEKVLDWCTHFAWRAPDQVSMNSFVSPYTSYYLAAVYKRHMQTLLLTRPHMIDTSSLPPSDSTLLPAKHPRPNGEYHYGQGVFASPPLSTSDLLPPQPPPLEKEKDESDSRVIVDASLMLDAHGYESPPVFSSDDETDRSYDDDDQIQVRCPSDPFIAQHDDDDDEKEKTSSSTTTAAHHPPPPPPPQKSFRKSTFPFLQTDDPNDVTRPRHNTNPPDAVFNSIQVSIDFLDVHNLSDIHVSRRTFKGPISPRELLYCEGVTSINQLASKIYSPRPQKNGAPDSYMDCVLRIPESASQYLKYQTTSTLPTTTTTTTTTTTASSTIEAKEAFCNYHQVRSISSAELHALQKKSKTTSVANFKPITIAASSHSLCQVLSPEIGTTGMIHVRVVDSGETNDIVVGLTWDLANECQDANWWFKAKRLEDTTPGWTSTSIGLSSNGTVHYTSTRNGRHVQLPHTGPFSSGSDVSIGIAYDRIYFVVDGVFYPPISDLFLPNKCSVHGLVRFGCPGIHISTQNMSSTWSEEMTSSHLLVHAPNNPLAHSLFLSKAKTRMCPHYLSHLRPSKCIPNFDHFHSVNYEDLPTMLSKQSLLNIRMCQLAREPCLGSDISCNASHVVRNLMSEIYQSVCAEAERKHLSLSKQRK